MRNWIALLIGLTVLSSCESSAEKAEKKRLKDFETIKSNISAKLNSYLIDNNGENSEGLKIDSIKLIRVDTLNEKLDSMNVTYAYFDKLDQIMEHMRLSKDIAKNKLDMAKLYAEIGSDYKSTHEEGKLELEKAKNFGKLHNEILEHTKLIQYLVKSNKLDSVKTTGYIGVVKVFARDKAMSNRNIDSAKFPLDTNFLISNKLAEIREFDHKKYK